MMDRIPDNEATSAVRSKRDLDRSSHTLEAAEMKIFTEI